jgi:N-acetylglutamate synthase-like GNAT family acetyltransferase
VNNIKIRDATTADARRLAELRYEFRSGLAGVVEDREPFIERCSAWMASRLANDWKCWVASREGTIVGQVWLHRIEKMPNPVGNPEVHAYITNLYVKPDSRGGVGGRLLAQALEWARQQAVDAVILWPTPRSRSLYLRYGFEAPEDMLELRCRGHSLEGI